MPNNLKKINEKYDKLKKINSYQLGGKSVLIIGGGYMGKEYAHVLEQLGINDVTIVTKSPKQASDFSAKFDYTILDGGFEKQLSSVGKKDLVIIAIPTELLISATKLAIKTGQTRILLEKPGSLFHKELFSLNEIIDQQKVRIGYNRLLYPNFHKIKQLAKNEGGITSCKFDFTEWIHKIPFGVYQQDEYTLWGISNSLHVISMAFELIGMPKEIASFQFGKLDWHTSGSIFVGAGMSEENIPFSYHANWESSGRWMVEIMTKENSYRLMPLEEIHVCKKGTVEWKSVDFQVAFQELKFGIAEQVVTMLDDKLEDEIGMVTIEKAIEYNKIAEKIFGYDTTKF
jgi:predicted dehydrogenase